MTSRLPIDDRSPARFAQGASQPDRWDAPPRFNYQQPGHAGPSRQPYDPRSVHEHAVWTTRAPHHHGMTTPSDAWPGRRHSPPGPTEAYLPAFPTGEMPIASARPEYAQAQSAPAPLTTSSASPLVSRRTSDEMWHRYEHASTVSATSASGFRSPPGRKPPPHRNAVSVPSPAEAHPPPSAASAADLDPPRARVACTFCRVRKLRCDGAVPCRHCERRSIDCVYAPTKTKAKPPPGREPSSPSKTGLDTASAPSAQQAGPDSAGRDRGTKRVESPSQTDSTDRSPVSNSVSPGESAKRLKRGKGSSRLSNTGGADTSMALSTPSSSMPGSDLAMIQNNDSPIPMEPPSDSHDEWWNHLLGVFGRSRSTSTRIVQHLLTRFVQSNAVFFGLLHAPTLLAVATGNRGHMRADPALYLAVLAVAACDMHQTRIVDERTSDMTSANEASRQLAARLSEMAASYLEASTAYESALTPSMGQAASILALTQPDGSSEQSSLIRLAENVVRALKLHETVSSREPLLLDSEPDSPLYWSRPLASDSPESEVKYESIVRLCWTGISHRFRNYIAKPDEGFGEMDLPEYIEQIRPMAFWQPSLLPEDLPPPFFHSQDLMRRSAHLSRLTVTLAKLEKIQEVESPDVLEQVRGVLQSLDELEASFARHRPRSEAERHNVLGRTLQMFCRMHVWVRLTIWRKYKLWSHASGASESLFQQVNHPTIEFWLTILHEMIESMEQDLDAHVVDMTGLKTTATDVDALARHVVCACDLVVASGEGRVVVGQVDRAIFVLKRMLAYAKMNEDRMRVGEDVLARVGIAEARRAELVGGAAETEIAVVQTDAVMDLPQPLADQAPPAPAGSPLRAVTVSEGL